MQQKEIYLGPSFTIKEKNKIKHGSKNFKESFSKDFMIIAGFVYNGKLKIKKVKK